MGVCSSVADAENSPLKINAREDYEKVINLWFRKSSQSNQRLPEIITELITHYMSIFLDIHGVLHENNVTYSKHSTLIQRQSQTIMKEAPINQCFASFASSTGYSKGTRTVHSRTVLSVDCTLDMYNSHTGFHIFNLTLLSDYHSFKKTFNEFHSTMRRFTFGVSSTLEFTKRSKTPFWGTVHFRKQ